MTIVKTVGIAVAGAAALIVATAPVAAAPMHHKKHQVCKIERVHGHAHKVCHWVR